MSRTIIYRLKNDGTVDLIIDTSVDLSATMLNVNAFAWNQRNNGNEYWFTRSFASGRSVNPGLTELEIDEVPRAILAAHLLLK